MKTLIKYVALVATLCLCTNVGALEATPNTGSSESSFLSEPGSLALLSFGLIGLGIARKEIHK